MTLARRTAALLAVLGLAALPGSAFSQAPDHQAWDLVDGVRYNADAVLDGSNAADDALRESPTSVDTSAEPPTTAPDDPTPDTGDVKGQVPYKSGGTAKAWPGGGYIDRSRPVILIHGLDWVRQAGINCASRWDKFIANLRLWGHTGPFETIQYYDGDTNCTNDLRHHPSGHEPYYRHRFHHGSGGHRNYPRYDHFKQTDIRHLAFHLAWDIYERYNHRGAVNVVAHSMGGLMIRYALSRSQSGDPDFPPLQVRNVVTLGTPHGGTHAARACGWGPAAVHQCKQMMPGSGFISWMREYAQNPQGIDGTDWTVIGSEDDWSVSQNSATYGMPKAEHKVTYGDGRGHDDYPRDNGTALDANVKWAEQSVNFGWERHWNDAPRVGRWAERALATLTW